MGVKAYSKAGWLGTVYCSPLIKQYWLSGTTRKPSQHRWPHSRKLKRGFGTTVPVSNRKITAAPIARSRVRTSGLSKPSAAALPKM